jgi:hypothetical protein
MEIVNSKNHIKERIQSHRCGPGGLTSFVQWVEQKPSNSEGKGLMWPTATTQGWRSIGQINQMRSLVDNGGVSIGEAESMMGGTLNPERMQNWPTPVVQDSRHAKYRHRKDGNDWKSNLGEVVSAEVDGGNLNADWVEALMMWPIGWSGMDPINNLDWDINCSEWEPDIHRVITGQENRSKRLQAIGNGQVPLTMAIAFKLLSEDI